MVDFAAPAKAGAVFFVVGQNGVRPSRKAFSLIFDNYKLK